MKTNWMTRKIPRIASVLVIISALILSILVDVLPAYAVTREIYWVPDATSGTGTGNWSATGATGHWDDNSDGIGGDAVPDSDDNVYFNAASFNGAGQIVTVDVAASCLNMDWTGATNNPKMTSTVAGINIWGNLTLIQNMQLVGWASYYMSGANVNITTNNCAVLKITLGIYGTIVTLQDDLIMDATAIYSTITVLTGTFNTNGKTVTCYGFADGWVNLKVITLGGSTINCSTGGWNMADTTDLTINANTSTIKVSGTGVFTGGGKIYNNVELNGTAHTISGSNTFAKLSFKPAGAQTITFTDATTQTAASFERTGTGQITFQGSAAAGWALTDNNGGTNTFNALTVSRSTAGGATFNATTSSLNSGNNVGWTFPTTITNQAVSGILKYTATGNATITDQGGSAITERGFCWNTTGTPTTANPKVIVAGTLGTYTGAITGLLPTTTYHVRSYLVNGSGTTYGNEQDFIAVFALPSSLFGYTMIPLVFMALAVLLIIKSGFADNVGIKELILIAILVILMGAFLAGIQPQLDALP